jgi:hypothetical protein
MVWAAAAVLTALAAVACGGRASRSDAVGLADCDEYLAKVQSCMSSDPRLQAMAPAYRAQRDAWKQMARTSPDAVKANCKAALEGFAQAMPGCK